MSLVDSQTWSAADSVSLYDVDRWGRDYFRVSEEGHLIVCPSRNPEASVDLRVLVDRLQKRGLELPVLIRFNGILEDRLRRLHECFEQAITEYGYRNRYRCMFPVKVNPQREVVQQVIRAGAPYGFGVEAGSKSELLAVVAMADPQLPIVCNGFKDDDFIRMALMAQQIGRTVIPVVEKVSELDLILRHSHELGIRPVLGMRVKLATRGSGRWQASGGYRSKFGLTVAELLAQLDRLESLSMAECFKLLHFHVGSQITHIRQLKSAILEASRIYVDLHRRGAGLEYIDVGGGLGIDYDGSQSSSESSVNYTLQEYANDVVSQIQAVCDDAEVPHPQILSESGRAVAAHHSVLVMETLGVTAQGNVQSLPTEIPESFEQPVHDLWETFRDLTPTNCLEYFHDAQTSLDLCMNLFSGGYLPLEQRCLAENLYFAICHRVRGFMEDREEVPEELKRLDRMLSDIYFVNVSVFQSLPDAWAIDQLFPVMPIHRLDEQPTRHAVLGDITCDSDGKIDSFVGRDGKRQTLLLHPHDPDQPYLLGVFLVGAYQEILGDLHNLFGDTHAVHIDLQDGAVNIQSIVKGDTVREVLDYAQYDNRELIGRLQAAVESATHVGAIDNEQAGRMLRFYERCLAGYTYLTGETE